MPSKARKLDRTVAKLPSIPKELVNQFLTGPMTGEAINAAGLAFKQAVRPWVLTDEEKQELAELERRYPPDPNRPFKSTFDAIKEVWQRRSAKHLARNRPAEERRYGHLCAYIPYRGR